MAAAQTDTKKINISRCRRKMRKEKKNEKLKVGRTAHKQANKEKVLKASP